MGWRPVIVSSHLDGCVSLPPFLMVTVASALSQSESRLFLLPWTSRWIAVGSHGAGSSRKLLRFPCGLGLPVLSLDCELLTSSLSSPGSSHPGCHGSLSRVSTKPVWSTG